MLSFESAREKVIEIARDRRERGLARRDPDVIDIAREPAIALNRVLAEDVSTDRDYPPFDRSIRDGFALRAADATQAPTRLQLIGESKAGTAFNGEVAAGQCVQIMTGAPVPRGADAVVMVEYAKQDGATVLIERSARPGDYIVPAGSEARRGEKVLLSGTRLGYAEIAMAGQVGAVRLRVHARPRVAILSTGDEVVSADKTPGPYEIRNSNSLSLSAQVALSGAQPVALGNAPDRKPELREMIDRGLQEDVLVLSGGVSAGKYDLVEGVLADLGAEFFFEAVAIRPGRPAVFGVCREKLVFGLPGNPVSTMVTFEIFGTPALEVLGGGAPRPLPLFKARLKHELNEKGGLAHFLPARVTFPTERNSGRAPVDLPTDPTVETVRWQGSGDVVALVHANCYLLVHEKQEKIPAGTWVDVLPRRGAT
jgi:molybdopterin molybdotransferase